MTRKTMLLIVAAGFVGGLLGGFFSGRLFPGVPTYPQAETGAKRVIVAQEFHLVDQDGRERWALVLSKAGEPNFTFINKGGWAPMAMGVNDEGLPFFNMVLDPHKRGGPSLVMMDSTMRNRAILGLREDGKPFLTFLDATGQARAVLGRAEVKNPLTGSTEKRSVSSLVFMDSTGEVIWAAPQQKMMKQVMAEPETTWGVIY